MSFVCSKYISALLWNVLPSYMRILFLLQTKSDIHSSHLNCRTSCPSFVLIRYVPQSFHLAMAHCKKMDCICINKVCHLEVKSFLCRPPWPAFPESPILSESQMNFRSSVGPKKAYVRIYYVQVCMCFCAVPLFFHRSFNTWDKLTLKQIYADNDSIVNMLSVKRWEMDVEVKKIRQSAFKTDLVWPCMYVLIPDFSTVWKQWSCLHLSDLIVTYLFYNL